MVFEVGYPTEWPEWCQLEALDKKYQLVSTHAPALACASCPGQTCPNALVKPPHALVKIYPNALVKPMHVRWSNPGYVCPRSSRTTTSRPRSARLRSSASGQPLSFHPKLPYLGSKRPAFSPKTPPLNLKMPAPAQR
eukprot:3125795-Rhodomonas_salina.1